MLRKLLTMKEVVDRGSALSGAISLGVLAGVFVVWELAARLVDSDAFPPASAALIDAATLLRDREALGNIGLSLIRMLAGFAMACLVAVPLGLAMGRSRVIATSINPLLMVFYPVPKAALMPLLMLWIGVGDASKILVIFLGSSLPLIYHATQGGAAVDEKLVWSARAMGMGAVRRLYRIILPAALPQIVLGARTGLAMALIVMVSAEMIARENGIGDILFNALDMAVYPTVYAAILIVAAIGFLSDLAVVQVQVRLLKWSEPLGAVLPHA